MAMPVLARHVAGLMLLVPAVAVRAQVRVERDVPDNVRVIAGVRLNTDSAASLVATLGPAVAWTSGAGHDRYVNWCYRAGADAGGATLLVRSDASDTGTVNQELNVFEVAQEARAAVDGHACGVARVTRLRGIGDLRLGASRAAVRQLLGTPTRTTRDSAVYEFAATELLNPRESTYAFWNTPARRRSCFGGEAPFASVGGLISIVFRGDAATVIRVERYDNAIC